VPNDIDEIIGPVSASAESFLAKGPWINAASPDAGMIAIPVGLSLFTELIDCNIFLRRGYGTRTIYGKTHKKRAIVLYLVHAFNEGHHEFLLFVRQTVELDPYSLIVASDDLAGQVK